MSKSIKNRRHRLHATLLFAIGLLQAAAAWPLDRESLISQLRHQSWTRYESAPDTVTSFVHTRDGQLWLASAVNLYQFDGLRFDPMFPSIGIPSTNISATLESNDGALWLGFRFGGVTKFIDQQSTAFDPSNGFPDGLVHALAEDKRGVIWAATQSGLARFADGRWQHVSLAPGVGTVAVYGAFVDSKDTLWVATADALLALDATRAKFRLVRQLPQSAASTKYFAQAPDGGIWLSDRNVGVWRVDEHAKQGKPWFANHSIGPILFDREGNLWMAGNTLMRLPAAERGFDLTEEAARAGLDTFSREDGLSGNQVRTVFEDREGNIWVATNAGVDRFSRNDFLRQPLPPKLESWGELTLVTGDNGTVWAAASSGPELLRFEKGKLAARFSSPKLSAATRAPDGTVWFAGPQGIARVQDERLHVVSLPEEVMGADVQAMAIDRDGAIWVSVVGNGLYRYAQGVLTPFGGLPALPREPAISAVVSSQGDIWFGYTRNRIARISGDRVTLFSSQDGIRVGTVTALFPNGESVWIGGELGLAFFDGQKIHTLKAQNCQPFSAVTGLVETADGDVWINRGAGLSLIRSGRSQLKSQSNEHKVACSTYGAWYGLEGAAQQSKSSPSMVQATDGRLWLASTRDLIWTHPDRLLSNENAISNGRRQDLLPPRAVIDSLRSYTPDDKMSVFSGNYMEPSRPKQLPAHTRDLSIQFSAHSLTAPDMVRFKARLVGYDNDWRLMGRRREKTYTNLGPGDYRFEVSASFDGENYHHAPATVSFEILPAFYQTTWFYALCIALWLFMVAMLYRFQLQRASVRLRERLEERMNERERIARELHDTLLQGVQALILRVHAASLRLPEKGPVREMVERAIEDAEEVLVEGRDRVTDLRNSGATTAEIVQELGKLGARLAAESDISFRSNVAGKLRELHPIVQEETVFIAREALMNAFRHAHASSISLGVRFERAGLRVVVADDGRGIPLDVRRKGGVSGHWGMQGMRERARRLRASLYIGPGDSGGTQVALYVPATIAYRARVRTRSWLSRAARVERVDSLDEPKAP